MSKRNIMLILFMVFALLLCEINLTVTDASYRFALNAAADNGTVQDQSLAPIAYSDDEFCTRESNRGTAYGSLFNIRSQTKGKGVQRLGPRILLIFVSVLCLLSIASRYLKRRLLLPKDAGASSNILLFIHSKDGKK